MDTLCTNAVYLLTAVIIHLSVLTAGLSFKDHHFLAIQLARLHLYPILLTGLTIGWATIAPSENICITLFAVSLILSVTAIYKGWGMLQHYFSEHSKTEPI